MNYTLAYFYVKRVLLLFSSFSVLASDEGDY